MKSISCFSKGCMVIKFLLVSILRVWFCRKGSDLVVTEVTPILALVKVKFCERWGMNGPKNHGNKGKWKKKIEKEYFINFIISEKLYNGHFEKKRKLTLERYIFFCFVFMIFINILLPNSCYHHQCHRLSYSGYL